MTLFLGKREVKLVQLGAGHTSGDIVAWVPDAQVMFSGDLIEYHSACYCGDAHLRAWPGTLNAIREFDPSRLLPDAGMPSTVRPRFGGVGHDTRFRDDPVRSRRNVRRQGPDAERDLCSDPGGDGSKFGSFAIYEHCLPFNVARAYDEASGIDDPVIWTAERDREMWEALQA